MRNILTEGISPNSIYSIGTSDIMPGSRKQSGVYIQGPAQRDDDIMITTTQDDIRDKENKKRKDSTTTCIQQHTCQTPLWRLLATSVFTVFRLFFGCFIMLRGSVPARTIKVSFFQNHYTHEIIIFKLFKGLQFSFQGSVKN